MKAQEFINEENAQINAVTSSTYELRKAKELAPDTFSSPLSIESTIGDISLAKAIAQRDANDFLFNKSSVIRKTFEANL